MLLTPGQNIGAVNANTGAGLVWACLILQIAIRTRPLRTGQPYLATEVWAPAQVSSAQGRDTLEGWQGVGAYVQSLRPCQGLSVDACQAPVPRVDGFWWLLLQPEALC
uniref:Uncharacterized protein n=1 Tax=Eutreptiella gymnastica TaxID=73025 RepID=A0A7S1IV99_9EUGL